MTSAWKEPPSRGDRAEDQDIPPDENQLEMFDTVPPASGEMLLPSQAELIYDSALNEGGGRRHVVVTDMSAPDFLDAGGADPDELRRLEDSIRWLMNESGVRHIPRASTLPPVRGLTPVETHDDSLLLNPETLFPPRLARRQGSRAARSAAKILLAGAVVAPATYFIANWMQFPGTAAPSSSAAVSESATIAVSATIPRMPEERIAAVTPPAKSTPPEVVQVGSEMSGAIRPEASVSLAAPPADASPDVVADASATEPKRALELPPEISAPPPPSDPAPGSVGANAAQSSSPPPPVPVAVVAPPRPVLSAREIALMLERGRVLFDAGDLAAARLFFRRAANAGDAQAALAMGATYDPDVLARRFIRGIEADAQEARMWYERARELGSPEGPRRIEMLAHR